MSAQVDPIPPHLYPVLTPFAGSAPAMPPRWQAVALLQPFSPPQAGNAQPNSPFFQLCLANLSYVEGEYFSAQIAGTEYGSWWYIISPQGTRLSTDKGATWVPVDMGWQLPASGWFGSAQPTCAGTSPLNWMTTQTTEWWKIPVVLPSGPPAATWMWFDAQGRQPVRMMYGQGPASPTQGDPNQLPLLQMYSFTYFPQFKPSTDGLPPIWMQPLIDGFKLGNPGGYSNFVFNPNFGMTALMTPVNEKYNPLPTRVLYVWKPDAEYSVATDRAQSTLMLNTYNQGLLEDAPMASQEALLTGHAPKGTRPPAGSHTSFLITTNTDGTQTCAGPKSKPPFDFPQEAPDWVSIPGVQATIRATITDNPVLCPNTTILIYSVLFPPATPNYPDSTYLWTWYAPLTKDGKLSRPVTFMQSQSGVGVGTSLALADYFAFEVLAKPIDPANFTVPAVCNL
jgi:hypothetical protein